MKKFLTIILAVVLCVATCIGLVGCSNSKGEGNSDNNQTEKIELTLQNYTQYIDVKEKIKVTSFNLKQIAGIYTVSGTGTLTYTVYPKQPIKCYNVVMNFSNKTPYGVTIGVDAEFVGTPHINVPADGNVTESVNLKFVTDDDEVQELYKQVVYYGRTESDMRNSIENTFVYGLSSVIEIKGYVVVD